MTNPTDYNAGLPLTESVTAAQTALTVLQRLGRSELADPILTDAEATAYTTIINDTTRSQGWITTTCAAKYIAVMSTIARKLSAAAKSAGTQDADDTARVFGIRGLAGDVASLSISLRDAADRVAGINDSLTLRRMLGQATATGDETLAHAIVQVALSVGDLDTVNQFEEAYPALAAPIQRLWDTAQRKQSGFDLQMGWRLASLKPSPLASLQDYEIASAAAGNADAGTWNV